MVINWIESSYPYNVEELNFLNCMMNLYAYASVTNRSIMHAIWMLEMNFYYNLSETIIFLAIVL